MSRQAARHVALVTSLALLPTGNAHAQYAMASPMLYEGPRISLQDHADRSTQDSASAATAAPDAAVPAALLTYRPDPVRRKANIAAFVAKTRAVDPAGADGLAAMFAKGNFFAELQKALPTVGLRVDNVADAYALYWVAAYNATRGINPTPSRAQMDAVKGQTGRALARTPEFAAATDATKQELAETLWIQMFLLDSAIDQSKGKPDQLAKVGRAAATGARGMGLDLTGMTLTETGFVRAQR